MASKDTDGLLPEWQKDIQTNFVGFRENMEDLPGLLEKLRKEGVITTKQKEDVVNTRTLSRSVDILMVEIVLGLTVGKYKKFRQILLDTGNDRLAAAIPDPEKPDLDCKTAAKAILPGFQAEDRRRRQINPNTDTSGVDGYQRWYMTDIPHDKVLKTYSARKKGLCVIFVNFTNHLKGYKIDVENIRHFFYAKLEYEVHVFTNLSFAKTKEKIIFIQNKLGEQDPADEYRPVYDRLALFVLSHGDQDGMIFCSDTLGTSHSEEPRKRLTLQQIQEFFDGNSVPILKGKPKFFVFQCCRGDDIVRTAATSVSPEEHRRDIIDALNEQRHLIPIDSDFLVSYSCTTGNKSVVSDSYGSWFIKSMIDVFKAYEERLGEASVEDMLKVVNNIVSKKNGYSSEGQLEVLRQMPCYFTTLTHKFCLK